MIECCINYVKDTIQNGHSCFYPPAQQLARHLERKNDKYAISFKMTWLGAEIYAQQVIRQQSWFASQQLGDKVKIAELGYDADSDLMTYFVSSEIKQDKDFFKLDFEIVKNLRDTDLIRIRTIERDVRHKVFVNYSILKGNLKNADYRVEPGIYGDEFIVSSGVFKRVVGSLVKKAKKGKKQ